MADDAAAPKRRPYSPKLDNKLDPADPRPSVALHLRMPGRLYDLVWKSATQARLTVPEYIRHCLSRLDPSTR